MSGPVATVPVIGGPVAQARLRGSAISQAVAVPNLDGAILGWFRPMTIAVGRSRVTLATDPKGAGRTIFEFAERRTEGHLQPGSPQKLKVKQQGNRAWKNALLYTLPNLDVPPDALMRIDGVVYRIAQKTDWTASGYIAYELLETPLPNA